MKYHGLIPVYITELYWGDDRMIPCDQVAEGVYDTVVFYSEPQRIPTGFAIWNWGELTSGANLDPCTDQIADAVVMARAAVAAGVTSAMLLISLTDPVYPQPTARPRPGR